jgi:hypothetical protein
VAHLVFVFMMYVIAGHGESSVCNFMFIAGLTSSILLIVTGILLNYGIFT